MGFIVISGTYLLDLENPDKRISFLIFLIITSEKRRDVKNRNRRTVP